MHASEIVMAIYGSFCGFPVDRYIAMSSRASLLAESRVF
jgi:hypothetical protein